MTSYIGTVTINNLKYLQQTLNSIVVSPKHDFKVMIIDNGSNNETQNWVVSKSSCEHIINHENKGVSVAWNQIIYWAMSHGDCESIFILNNDIVLHPETMDLLIEDLQGKYDGISGVIIGNNPAQLQNFNRNHARWSPAMTFSCFGLTPECIKRVGYFDENFKRAYFEDNDYHLRMNNEGIINAADQWAPLTHYGSRSLKEGGVQHEPYFTQNRQYFKKKWGFLP